MLHTSEEPFAKVTAVPSEHVGSAPPTPGVNVPSIWHIGLQKSVFRRNLWVRLRSEALAIVTGGGGDGHWTTQVSPVVGSGTARQPSGKATEPEGRPPTVHVLFARLPELH